jgi:hypothetical protein
MTYNMEPFLRDSVSKYTELTGNSRFRKVTTPCVEDPEWADDGVNIPSSPEAIEAKLKEGELKHVAARILMKVLYCARMCRYDLLHAIGRLACRITPWDVSCDRALHRLMCYIHSTHHIREVGWVGDSAEDVSIHLFADADFGGDKETSRNTSGAFLCLAGPDTFFPIQAFSKKQTAVSQHAGGGDRGCGCRCAAHRDSMPRHVEQGP